MTNRATTKPFRHGRGSASAFGPLTVVVLLTALVLLTAVVLVAPASPAHSMPRHSWRIPTGVSQPQVTTHRMGAGANERRVIAHSVEGRPIVARHYGDLDAPIQLVVIGQMHGSEPGGTRVVHELARRPVPVGVGLWLISTINPDGDRRHTRANAHGVDLNRNFPHGWQSVRAGGVYWPGPRAASEPETRGVIRFLTRVKPAAVLSYHQAFDLIDLTHERSRAAGRQLATWMGERAAIVTCAGPCHGTMTQWIDAELRSIALTVELDHAVSDAEARRAATAVLRLGTWLDR